MEGLGLISTRLLAMAMMLFVFLATPTSLASPSLTPTPATPPKNSKVYRCGEGCARKLMGLAEKSDNEFTGCTIGCMDPC